MELLGHQPATVHGSLNYGDPWPNNKTVTGTYTLASGTFNDDYHIFSIIWDVNVVQWLVDDQLYEVETPSNLAYCSTGLCPWRFDENFFIIFNLAVGGNWPGNPDQTTVFPQMLKVDYVRVFQKN